MTDWLQRAQGLKLRPEISDGRGADPFVQRERAFAGVDHVEVGQPQIVEGGEHGAGQRRGRGPLELEPESGGSADDEQIQLGPSVSRPEEALLELPGNMCACRSDFTVTAGGIPQAAV